MVDQVLVPCGARGRATGGRLGDRQEAAAAGWHHGCCACGGCGRAGSVRVDEAQECVARRKRPC
eukprot:10258621-Prorocentrum_lima.AAC.1